MVQSHFHHQLYLGNTNDIERHGQYTKDDVGINSCTTKILLTLLYIKCFLFIISPQANLY